MHTAVIEVRSNAYTKAGHKRKLEEMVEERQDSGEIRRYRESLCAQLDAIFVVLASDGIAACTLTLCAERSMHEESKIPVLKEVAENDFIWTVTAMSDVTEVLALGLCEWALENGIMCTFSGRNYREEPDGGSASDEQVLKFTWA